jgi:hypothetical protein
VLAAYNEVNDPDLLSDMGWTPALFIDLLDTQDVLPAVEAGAGPFNWLPFEGINGSERTAIAL